MASAIRNIVGADRVGVVLVTELGGSYFIYPAYDKFLVDANSRKISQTQQPQSVLKSLRGAIVLELYCEEFMPGAIAKNFRPGNLAEDMGLLLLKQLAAVAPIPRQEDYGIDALVTLLRDNGTRRLLAADTFFVQLKTASIREIKYDSSGIEWLRSQRLPVVLGSVDRSSGEISLYPMIGASQLQGLMPALSVSFHLDSTAEITGDTRLPNLVYDNNRMAHFHIPAPLARWDFDSVSNNESAQLIFETIAQFIEVALEEARLNKLGTVSHVSWETNSPRIGRTIASVRSGWDEMLQPLIDTIVPNLRSMVSSLCFPGSPEKARVVNAIHDALVALETLGYTIPDFQLLKALVATADAPMFSESSRNKPE